MLLQSTNGQVQFFSFQPSQKHLVNVISEEKDSYQTASLFQDGVPMQHKFHRENSQNLGITFVKECIKLIYWLIPDFDSSFKTNKKIIECPGSLKQIYN